jgi:iron(III) transport system permease protein
LSSFAPISPSARRLRQVLLLVVAAALVLPVLAVFGSWLQWNGQSAQILSEMARTVLPEYIRTSLWLCLLVAAGAALVGSGTAAAVTLFDFPGRRHFEWMLLLPLAMPAYVVAYAYTDFLQFSGPLQRGLRAAFGWEGRVFPEVRSLGGAAWVFTFALYPYVYLLARTALAERAAHLMEAAARRAAVAPRAPRGPAAGAPGRGCGRGAGADGNTG